MDRVLRLEIPPCDVQKLIVDLTWTNTSALNGWNVIDIGGAPSLALEWSGTIDLSGYVRDQLTFYPQSAFTQQGPFLLERNGGDGSILYTIVSSIPLDAENVLDQLVNMNSGPGFLNLNTIAALGLGTDQQNYETVMFANSELYVNNLNIAPNTLGIQQLLNSEQSGSLEPTAVDTLYVMKLWLPLGGTQTRATLPASRVIIPGTFGTEPDVEYMMRLKRSVELSQQV